MFQPFRSVCALKFYEPEYINQLYNVKYAWGFKIWTRYFILDFGILIKLKICQWFDYKAEDEIFYYPILTFCGDTSVTESSTGVRFGWPGFKSLP